jgi:WXXGXW repeat (2 copies)
MNLSGVKKMLLKSWSRSILPTLFLLALPALSMAQVSLNISVNVPPPELPVYDQPPIPAEGYLWTPGYWAWGDDIQDYYWVPGTWVEAPQPGYLWTPGYWGWQNGVYLWNGGYWGEHVGFYGGVNYGFGYGGAGFEGGYWQGGHLFYNRSVMNVGETHITNVYNKTVINNVTVTHVSFNGGAGGVRAQATSAELAVAREPHVAAVAAQREHEQTARSNPALRASNNKGKPPIAATAKPGAFSGAGVVAAKKGGAVSAVRPASAAHAAAPAAHAAAPAAHAAAPAARAEQPAHAAAPPAHPTAAPRPAPAVHEPAAPRAPQPAREPAERPAAAEAPHEAAPPPHPVQPRPAQPKPAPRPAEHPPAREEDHEHH